MEKGVSLETDLITFTKIDSQWITDLNENHKIVKLLEKNRRKLPKYNKSHTWKNIVTTTHNSEIPQQCKMPALVTSVQHCTRRSSQIN